MGEVYQRIKAELHRREKTWVWFAGELGEPRQVVNNWSRIGVPAARWVAIADVFGWSLDYLVHGIGTQQRQLLPVTLEIAEKFDAIEDARTQRIAYHKIMAVLDAPLAPLSFGQSPATPPLEPAPTPRRARHR